MKSIDYFRVTNSGGAPIGMVSTPWTVSPTSLAYTMQSVGVSMTSLPVDGRGGYNKSFQIVGTFSALTNIAIDVSLHPFSVTTPTYPGIWYTIGNLSTPTWYFAHSGGVRAFRARTMAVSNSDSFDVCFYMDDAG